MNIGFFLSEYPALNETFILNEMFYLQQAAIEGHIFYEEEGNFAVVHPVEKRIHFTKTHIYHGHYIWRHLLYVLFVHIRIQINHPYRYMRALLFLMRVWSFTSIRNFLLAGMLMEKIERSHIDLLYIHDAPGISLIGLFCKYFSGLSCGIIFHTYGIFSDASYLQEKITFCDFSIFQSFYSRQYVMDMLPLDDKVKQRMHVVSSTGVDVQFFAPSRTLPKEKIKKALLKLVSVGRLEEMKGFDKLINAIAVLKQKHIIVQCTIVGYGSQREVLQKLINYRGLTNEVKLIGPMGHAVRFRTLLHRADIFVLPSLIDARGDRDMQPNAVKEAMATGCIVLTSNLGGIDEVIVSGVNGFLLTSTEPSDIAQAIGEVLQMSKKEKLKIQNRARRTIVDNYEAQKINALLIDVFRKYLRDDFIE